MHAKRCAILMTLAMTSCRPFFWETRKAPPPPPPPPPVEDFLGEKVTVTPLGPVDRDRATFGIVADIESSNALADPAAVAELEAAYGGASQILVAASIPNLFRAGVVSGNLELVRFACENTKRVAHQGLRRKSALAQYEAACRVLEDAEPMIAKADADCRGGLRTLAKGYHTLAGGDETLARGQTAKALRMLAACGHSRKMERTPADPASRGFLLVVALQMLGAPRATYLGGEKARPEVAKEINRAYVAGARVVKGEQLTELFSVAQTHRGQ